MAKKMLAGLFTLVIVFFGGLNTVFADHGGDDVDCSAFSTAAEVWEFWNSHDYSADNDPSDLDRGDSELPCENLTEGTTNPAATSSDDETATEEDEADDAESEDEEESAAAEEDEEGGELPNTATNNPLMISAGFAIAGLGFLLMVRRRRME